MNSPRTTQFGNPVLRNPANKINPSDIKTEKIQNLIKEMNLTLESKKLGIGLAAPQVGEPVALAIVNIQRTKHRQKVKPFKLTIINPVIIKTFGYRTQMWEGCISSGSGKAGLFAKVPRYKKVTLEYLDGEGNEHTKTFSGLQAHVIQHEVDHLNGVLFVDKVKDTRTYMTYAEYLKMVKLKAKTKK